MLITDTPCWLSDSGRQKLRMGNPQYDVCTKAFFPNGSATIMTDELWQKYNECIDKVDKITTRQREEQLNQDLVVLEQGGSNSNISPNSPTQPIGNKVIVPGSNAEVTNMSETGAISPSYYVYGAVGVLLLIGAVTYFYNNSNTPA